MSDDTGIFPSQAIQALIDDGMSEDEVVAARPALDFEGPYGNSETFVRRAYAGLSGN